MIDLSAQKFLPILFISFFCHFGLSDVHTATRVYTRILSLLKLHSLSSVATRVSALSRGGGGRGALQPAPGTALDLLQTQRCSALT